MEREFYFGRRTGLPLETRGCIASFDGDLRSLTIRTSTQVHYAVRQCLAMSLGLAENDIRVLKGDVGGGFGSKSRVYLEEVIVAFASKRLRRPVKWIEDRFENLQATTHSRDIRSKVEIAYDDGGYIKALRGTLTVDVGAYIFTSGIVTAEVASSHATGPYKIDNLSLRVICVGTNKTPLATYRGSGQPEATFPVECLIDLIAESLSVPADVIRRRNLIGPVHLPYTLTTSYSGRCVIESGDYPAMLDKLVAVSGYDEKVTQSAGRRSAWGIALGLESTGFLNYESARVRIDQSGRVYVASGLSSHGQGQATTLARVCADALGVKETEVSVELGDTQLLPFGRGTFASRGAVVGANAVHEASIKLRYRVLSYSSRLLQCDPADLSIKQGSIIRQSGEDTSLNVGGIARAIAPYGQLYEGDVALEETHIYDTRNQLTFAMSAHAARVSVCERTGRYEIQDYVLIHDAGVMLDPLIVKGQLEGAVADGISGACLAEITYNEDGQITTSTMADYLVATAAEIPSIRMDHVFTRPSSNVLGVRGVGEGGIIAVAPAIVNAVRRAIGVKVEMSRGDLFRLPLRPEAVLTTFHHRFIRPLGCVDSRDSLLM